MRHANLPLQLPSTPSLTPGTPMRAITSTNTLQSSRQAPMPGSRSSFAMKQFLFTSAALYLLIAPISTRADDSQLGYSVKYLRIAISVFVAIAGMKTTRISNLGRSSKAMLVFAMFFTGSALWSDLPIIAALNKGMFLIAFLAGITVACSIGSVQDVYRGLRSFASAALLGVTVIILKAFFDPEHSYVFGRLAVFSMNANNLGQAAAVFSVPVLAFAAIERTPARRYLAVLTVVGLVYIVIQTGSRGALVMILLASMLVSLGFLKGRAESAMLSALAVIAVSLVFLFFWMPDSQQFSSDDATTTELRDSSLRITREMFKDTRSTLWRRAFDRWKASPLIGEGWAHSDGRVVSVMNMYLQVLLESGLIGLSILMLCLCEVIGSCSRLRRLQRNWEYRRRILAWLAIGSTLGLFVHGFAESSTLLGASSNSLLFGFSIGLLDKLPSVFGVQIPYLRTQH